MRSSSYLIYIICIMVKYHVANLFSTKAFCPLPHKQVSHLPHVIPFYFQAIYVGLYGDLDFDENLFTLNEVIGICIYIAIPYLPTFQIAHIYLDKKVWVLRVTVNLFIVRVLYKLKSLRWKNNKRIRFIANHLLVLCGAYIGVVWVWVKSRIYTYTSSKMEGFFSRGLYADVKIRLVINYIQCSQ